MTTGTRIEILWWHNAEQKSHWIPGVLLNRHEDGRCVVKADCGWYCNDAAPECVREVEQ